MLVEIFDQAGLLEDPALPRLRCAGNLTRPRSLLHRHRVHLQEISGLAKIQGQTVAPCPTALRISERCRCSSMSTKATTIRPIVAMNSSLESGQARQPKL
jgi:hypothetical protein